VQVAGTEVEADEGEELNEAALVEALVRYIVMVLLRC
jgi:hypothetical protein